MSLSHSLQVGAQGFETLNPLRANASSLRRTAFCHARGMLKRAAEQNSEGSDGTAGNEWLAVEL